MIDRSVELFRNLSVPEMEAILSKFEERVNSAQQNRSPSKHEVQNVLRRKNTGPCPVRLKRHSIDLILKYGNDLADLFCEYPDDVVAIIPYDITIGYQPPEKVPYIHPTEAMMRGMTWKDEWGTLWGHAFGGVGATPVNYPIKYWSDLDEYIIKKIPDPHAKGRFDQAAAYLAPHHNNKYCFGIIHLALFERLHSLRGMENVFIDLFNHLDETRRLLEVLLEYLLGLVAEWFKLGVDGIFFTDDWGSQRGLLISPDFWRTLFKPYYKTLFETVHQYDMDVLFHSCGNVISIVGDLIDLNVDVLDPIQPGAMDIENLSAQFGGKIAFSGGVDVQNLLTHGTPQQIRDTVQHMIDTLGIPYGGSFLIGPANVMTPDIPFKNIIALFESTHNS